MNSTTEHTIDQDTCLACQEERQAPKPVESGELREKLAIIRNKMFDGMYDHMPEKGCTAVTDDVMAEIEALIAQEKAEWVAEVLSKCDEKEIVLMGTECKYCGDYVDYCNCHKIRQNQRDEIRQALQGENK